MKPRRFFLAGIALTSVVAGVAYWSVATDVKPSVPAKTRDAERTPRPRMEAPEAVPTRAARRGTDPESIKRFHAFAAESEGPLSMEYFKQMEDFLVSAIPWSRKELTALAEEMMTRDLSTQKSAYLFGNLLNIVSSKDKLGALHLYDRAWESSNFNRDMGYSVHELVLNLADDDPAGAIQWVNDRKSRMSPEVTAVLLEKIDENAKISTGVAKP